MWSEQDVAEAIVWGALIMCAPFIFFLARKISIYIISRFWPRDVLITYKNDGKITEAYYIKQSFISCKYYKLSQEQLRELGDSHYEK